MKKIFITLLVAVVLVSCGEQNPPSFGSNDVDFTIQQLAPFMYQFTNTSRGADSYKWDFGDGTWSNGKDATHTYENAGAYTVTLTATKGSDKYDCRKKLTVKKPKIYISGYSLQKIPYENKYYKVKVEDDDIFTSWAFSTVYTPLLDNTDIPYTIQFQNMREMTNLDGDNYYNIYVYYTGNASNSSGDKQCLHKKLYKTAIYEYQSEQVLTSDNGDTKVAILFHYE